MSFPELTPTSRSFTGGVVPIASYSALSGKETRVILGDTPVNHQISLSFANVNEDTATKIFDHWSAVQGIALEFELPINIWAGWSTYNSAVSANQKWRYSSPPSVSAVSPSIMTISVSLVSVI